MVYDPRNASSGIVMSSSLIEPLLGGGLNTKTLRKVLQFSISCKSDQLYHQGDEPKTTHWSFEQETRSRCGTHTRTPLVVVTESVMRAVMFKAGRLQLTCPEEVVSLPRDASGECHWSQSRKPRSSHTCPFEIQGYQEHEVESE